MGHFLTYASRIEQIPEKSKFKLLDNELFLDDDGHLYLAWRGYKTDNFTWIKNVTYDIRCSHIHDVGCQYHNLVRVNMSLTLLKSQGYLHEYPKYGKMIWVCEDIPLQYLEVVSCSKLEVNNLFYRMLKAADTPQTPRHIQILYRLGVCFNLNWYRLKPDILQLNSIYTD